MKDVSHTSQREGGEIFLLCPSASERREMLARQRLRWSVFLIPLFASAVASKSLEHQMVRCGPGQWRALEKLGLVRCWVVSSWVMGHGKGQKWG